MQAKEEWDMSEREFEEHQLEFDRRDLFVKGGLLVAGAGLLGSPAAAAAPSRSAQGFRYAVITHGAGDAFWAVVKRGVQRAAKDLSVSVTYSESSNRPQRQAQLIDTAVARKPRGIAVSAPNPDALKDALRRATRAKIPVITLNSGVNQFKQLGAITHVGQTETLAGRAAGQRLKAAGAKNLLVVIHEQGNIGLEQRYSGARAGFRGGKTQRLQVAGVADLARTANEIRTKLTVDRSIDAVLGLNPQVGIAARDAVGRANSRARVATFDLSGDVITSIQGGRILFAVDQQQYMQGYLPVVLLYLFSINLNTAGGGQPILTGPGFVDRSNAARVAALAKKGTR
jgi:simple sugar transport system substrate-binding protein